MLAHLPGWAAVADRAQWRGGEPGWAEVAERGAWLGEVAARRRSCGADARSTSPEVQEVALGGVGNEGRAVEVSGPPPLLLVLERPRAQA